jgi:RNA polymerase sigma-70 factor (ECF subfamily)
MRGLRDDRRTDAQLLQQANADPDAFGIFYRRHAAPVLAFVNRRVNNPESAFDITAEVFASALEAASRFEPERGDARAWLLGIARNEIVDAFRAGRANDSARRRLQMLPVEITDQGLERLEAAIAAEDSVVMQAFDRLPHAEREALQARIIDERDYQEIGEALALSESVIRKRVSRGLARLRPALVKDE